MLLCAVMAFAACEQAPIEEQSAIRYEAPDTITVGFEGDDTRIQLNEAQKTVWTKGDQVSVFYKSYDNLKFEFEGNTGDRDGTLKRVGGQHNGQTMDDVVVVYPYSADYMITLSEGCVNATIPSTQTYLKGSYGVGDNLMIARSSFNQFSLKSVCGWLKIQLTGDGEVIERITFRGNNGEQVAGLVYVDATTAEATLATAKHNSDDNSQLDGTLVLDDSIYTEVTLDCGEGVALGKNATAFYIALPPQAFEQGFTVEIEDAEGYVMEQSTDKALTIERNHIQPMAAFEFINPATPSAPAPASNEIWYTSSDGKVVTPQYTNVFGANITSNEYNNDMGIITFDVDVTTIGNSAFFHCDSLTSVNIPDSVTTIGSWAFSYCTSLTSVNIPDSVTTIGETAFYNCDSLTSVNIPDSVTTIGYAAFRYCDSLISVNIPDSITTIGNHAFAYCRSLTSVNIPDSVTTIGSSAFFYCGRLTSVNIPDSVTTIGSSAFNNCTSLTSVNIPDSVTTIGSQAFFNCNSLTSVNIPDSVTTIGEDAFYSCRSLTSVYCKATTPPALGGTEVFDNNGSGRKIYVPAGSVNAYKSAANWSQYADAIVGYDFEKGEVVNEQPNNEIWYTSSNGKVVTPFLTNVFGANIISNEYNNGMGVITFDGDVTTIGDYAFNDRTRLTSVNIPDSVTWIGSCAFWGCDSLTSVYCYATIPPSLGIDVFYDNASGRQIYVYEECVELYKSAWSDYKDSIFTNGKNCPETTTIQYTTNDGNTITSSNLPIISNIYENGVGTLVYSGKQIPHYAFEDYTSLTSVNIPDSVTKIGYAAFAGCTSLKEFKGKFATEDGRSLIMDNTIIAYANASGTTYTIPDSVTTIGACAFYCCDSLTSVNIPDSVTEIGYAAFDLCTSLTSVTIPDSVTTIGDAAFKYCGRMTSVTIGDSVNIK